MKNDGIKKPTLDPVWSLLADKWPADERDDTRPTAATRIALGQTPGSRAEVLHLRPLSLLKLPSKTVPRCCQGLPASRGDRVQLALCASRVLGSVE